MGGQWGHWEEIFRKKCEREQGEVPKESGGKMSHLGKKGNFLKENEPMPKS